MVHRSVGRVIGFVARVKAQGLISFLSRDQSLLIRTTRTTAMLDRLPSQAHVRLMSGQSGLQESLDQSTPDNMAIKPSDVAN
jgi:hypothetical protein